MSSMGLGNSPVIYPTPLNAESAANSNDRGLGGSHGNSHRGHSSGFNNTYNSNKLVSPVLTRSSPLITKYTKRRLKKVKKLYGNSSTANLANEYISGNQRLKSSRSNMDDQHLKKNNPIYIKDTTEYKLHLIRKVFLPKLPMNNSIQDYLPALTSSSPVDIELYCFFGLIFKNFINLWYSRISDNDEFTLEIIDVLAHLTRNLETRFRKLNFSDLLLDDIPYILNNHREFYLFCLNNLNSQYIQCNDMKEAFDLLNNHPALSTKFKENEDIQFSNFSDFESFSQNLKFKLAFSNDVKLQENNKNHEIIHSDDNNQDADIGILNDSLFTNERIPVYNKEKGKALLEENYLFLLSKGILALLLPVDLLDCQLAKFFLRSIFANIVLRSIIKNLSEPDVLYKILIAIFSKMNNKNDALIKCDKEKNEADQTNTGAANENGNNISINTMIQLPKTIKWRIFELFRKISHFIAYLTDSNKTSLLASHIEVSFEDEGFDMKNKHRKENNDHQSRNKRNQDNFLTNPEIPIVDRFFLIFFNNLFNFSIENPVLYCIMKYLGLWFLSYNIEEIKLQSKKKKNGVNENQKLNSLINRNLFSIRINQIIYNLINKLIISRFLKNEQFIGSIIQTFRHLLFPNDDEMGPPRKIPDFEELQKIKIELFQIMKKNIPGWFKLFVFNEMPNKSYYFFTNKGPNSEGTRVDENDAGNIFIDEKDLNDETTELSLITDNIKFGTAENNLSTNQHYDHEDTLGKGTSTQRMDSGSTVFRSMVKTKTDYKLYLFIESLLDNDFNKLLIYNMLDHLLIELFPEMANLTPSELERH